MQLALFAQACTWRRHNSARARMASRGHVGVGIDTASTTPKPIFDGASRGRSQAKLQDGCRLARHWSGCRSRFGPRTRWSSRVCSFSTAVLNAARPRCVSVPRSRRRSKRTKAAASGASLVESRAPHREAGRKVPVRPVRQREFVCIPPGVFQTYPLMSDDSHHCAADVRTDVQSTISDVQYQLRGGSDCTRA